MATQRFPYDLPSEDALIELIRRDRPHEDARKGMVKFGDMYHAPTETEPGRTYVEMVNSRNGKKSWFVYRRLNIETVLNEYLDPTEETVINVAVPGEITPAKIVKAVNEKYGIKLDKNDTDLSTTTLPHTKLVFDLVMNEHCYAYYGTAKVYVNYFLTPIIARITEDGVYRLTESLNYREMEDHTRQ